MAEGVPLRRDAQRNRERLVAAAREVFAEKGLDVALDEIARRAGVSIGTLYNRFPARVDLVHAAFHDRVETVVTLAEHALEAEDAWAGFTQFVEQISRLRAADRGYNDLAARRLPQVAPDRGQELMATVVARAKEAGALREDFELTDMAFVTWAISRTIEATDGVRDDAWRRHLGLIFDGLRAAAATPLPVPPLTSDEVVRALDAC